MENILNELIDSYYDDILEDLQRLVKIPSVLDESTKEMNAPFGKNVRDVLDEVLAISIKLGFVVKDYEGYAASVKLGNEGKEVGVLCHADVVPANGKWKTAPFEPIIIDGKMYGRGTVDDKGPLVAVLYAMRAIKESGLPLKHHINHIIGCNEETGHECIKYYLTKEKCPDLGFSPDGLFPVIHGEKGILRYTICSTVNQKDGEWLSVDKIVGGSVVNAVPDLAKVWLSGNKEMLDNVEKQVLNCETEDVMNTSRLDEEHLLLQFLGVSSHAMQPWLGKNANTSMIRFLRRINELNTDMKKFVDSICELFEDGWQGINMGIACEDELSGKLSQNFGILNFENNIAEIKVDVRCPIHVSLKQIWKTISINCQKHGFFPEYWQMREPLYVPKEAPLVKKLLKVYNDMMSEDTDAVTIGGGTYCRDVENFVSFGPVFPYEKELAHEADEYIGIKELMLSAKLYAQALYSLVSF